jgi:hypothetical protein
VQIAWIKIANAGPTGELDQHGKQLQRDTVAVLQNARARFPNLRIVYLESRIFAGYANSGLNPEPYAYEGAFVVRRLIQAQIQGDKELNWDPSRGPVKSPLLLWGAYLWGDGLQPRQSDGLVWKREDLGGDGTHPSESDRRQREKLVRPAVSAGSPAPSVDETDAGNPLATVSRESIKSGPAIDDSAHGDLADEVQLANVRTYRPGAGGKPPEPIRAGASPPSTLASFLTAAFYDSPSGRLC